MYRFRASTTGDEVVDAAGLGQWIHVSVPTGSCASLLHVSVPTVVDVAAVTAATSNDDGDGDGCGMMMKKMMRRWDDDEEEEWMENI
ncbi:hypothetical protein LWI29_007330 [Acer saccharum]|uniref:Uncharacterized protein n=1 Tax=Acer saccharum TaxID=4024 RepID=A0AA39VN27_ACESA|nr:hypothetical protein LWI29_007330 [Acer saccharum]